VYGSDSKDGRDSGDAVRSVNTTLGEARPGDTVHLRGKFYEVIRRKAPSETSGAYLYFEQFFCINAEKLR
jgi:hypothetical protein